ncbi:MAG: biotin/lipoyl-binding protein [Lachnospiraceae bacterium]|nr:biotin/lipoyl-binding protein [Lachnospiraceae bacterium]
MQILKRILVAILITALVCGGIYGGLRVYRRSQQRAVAVYAVPDIALPSDYFMDDSQSYGSVTADRVQSVFITGTQSVREVLVTEGQEVKKGDVLLTYDTTLSSIQLERAENELAQQELTLTKAQRELDIIQHLTPSSDDDDDDTYYGTDYGDDSESTSEPSESETPEEETYEPQETGVRLGGSGTIDDPYIYLWSLQDALTEKQLLSMFTEDGEYPDILNRTTAALIFGNIGLIPVNVYADTEIEYAQEIPFDLPAAADGYDDAARIEGAPEIEFIGGNVEQSYEYIESHDFLPVESATEIIPSEYFEMPVEIVTDNVESTPTESTPQPQTESQGDNTHIEPAISTPAESTVSEPDTDKDDKDSSATQAQAADDKDESVLNSLPNEIYVILEIHKNDNEDAPIEQEFALHLIRDGRSVAARLVNPQLLGGGSGDGGDSGEDDGNSGEEGDLPDDVELIDDDDDEGYDVQDYSGGYDDDDDVDDTDDSSTGSSRTISSGIEDYSGHYTAKEIQEMLVEKQREVRDEAITYQMKILTLRQMKQEMASDSVRSKVDGVVNNSDAVIVVSGGGGYNVTIAVSELELSDMSQDQKVSVSSFMDESREYEGYISSKGDYPTSNMDGWSTGNPNVSYYPCVVTITDEAEFRDGDYVGVKYNKSNDDRHSFYIEAMFVRSDSSGRYVYAKGENGKLVRKNLLTGKSPDNYTVEVRGGITARDFLAFPYGSNVKEGADTEEASLDELYA